MAKKRSYARDSRGRFTSSGGSGGGPVTRLRAARAESLVSAVNRRKAANPQFVGPKRGPLQVHSPSGDIGVLAAAIRFEKKNQKQTAKARGLEAKVRKARQKR